MMLGKNKLNKLYAVLPLLFFFLFASVLSANVNTQNKLKIVTTEDISSTLFTNVEDSDLAKEREELVVGILSQKQVVKLENSPWKKTFERLNQHPDYYFTPLFLNSAQIKQSLQDDTLDFVICDAINYLIFAQKYGIFRLLTRTKQHAKLYLSHEGLSVYSLKKALELVRLSDLKHKNIAIINDQFSASPLFLKKFLSKHQLTLQDELQLDTIGNINLLLDLLKTQKIDAFISKSGLIEEYFNQDELSMLRVVNPRKSWQASFLHSSELIPEWPIAKLWFIDDNLANQISVLLMGNVGEPSETSSYFSKQYHWGVAKNYHSLNTLPYFAPNIKVRNRIDQKSFSSQIVYWISFIIICLLVVALILRIHATKVLNRQFIHSKESLELEIKERQEAQEQAFHHQAELAHVARLSTMGEMASGLAHELNQPLSAINTYVLGCIRRINMGTDKPEDILNALQLTIQQAERANSIIRRLRSFVRNGESHKTYSDINHLVNEVTHFMEIQLKNTNTSLTLELEQQLPPVLADIIQIEQVLINLLKNALEAMGDNEAPKIHVTTKQIKQSSRAAYVSELCVIELCVIDIGEGISEDKLKRIFNPFFTTKSSGMGMGLSISSSIIEAHDGKLYADNNSDRGSHFCFTLPAKEEL